MQPGIRLEDHDGAIRTAAFAALARFMMMHGLADATYTHVPTALTGNPDGFAPD